MKESMNLSRRLAAAIGLGLCGVWLGSASAATGEVVAAVTKIRSHDTAISPDWFQLDIDQAGTCATYGGKVFFLVKNDDHGKRQMAMVLMASSMGRSLRVGYDDVNLKSGDVCYVRYVDL